MTFATLRGSSLLHGPTARHKEAFLADLFAADRETGGGAGTGGGTPMGGTPGEATGNSFFSGFMSKGRGGAATGNIPNCVMIFIAKGKLYIAKENWNAWASDFSYPYGRRATKDLRKKELTERMERMMPELESAQ